VKKLAKTSAFRLSKEFIERNKNKPPVKKVENKFTIKTNPKI